MKGTQGDTVGMEGTKESTMTNVIEEDKNITKENSSGPPASADSNNTETEITEENRDENMSMTIFDRLKKHMKDVFLLVTLYVTMPTFDVFSDLFVTVDMFLHGHVKYGLWLLLPQATTMVLTSLLWRRLEPQDSKWWSWTLLLLQAWPQVLAIRVIIMILTGRDEWRTWKRILDEKVALLEPFTESLPSLYILTTIWQYERYIVKSFEWKKKDGWITASILSSMVSSSFGIIKFFKNGPTRFLPSKGCLNGYFTLKSIATAVSVMMLNLLKLAVFSVMLRERVSERLFNTVSSYSPEDCLKITLIHSYEYEKSKTII